MAELFGAVDSLAKQNERMSMNIMRQRRQQLINTFEKFDVDMTGGVNDQASIAKMKTYVKRVCELTPPRLASPFSRIDAVEHVVFTPRSIWLTLDDAKMENLILDLDGDGEVSMEEFMAVLMKDTFWSSHAEADEALLHPLTPVGKG